MHSLMRMALVSAITFAFGGVTLESAFAQDVYIAYAGKDKALMKSLGEFLPEDFQVKTYNVDLLGLADYSGVQKAAAKLSRAKIVILLQDGPSEMLSGSEIDTDMLIVNSLNRTVRSSGTISHILGSNTDTSSMPPDTNRVEIGSVSELMEMLNLGSSGIFIVDETNITTIEAAAVISQNLADSKQG